MRRQELLERWARDPVVFGVENLGFEMWRGKERAGQAEIARGVYGEGEAWGETVVRAGNGVGKTQMLAALALWFLQCWGPCKVVTISGSWRQLEDQLWPAILEKARRARVGTPETCMLRTSIRLDDEWFATGESTDQPGKIEGYHHQRLMVIVDEAKAVEEPIWEAIHSLLAASKFTRLVVASVPGGPEGRFWRMCTGNGEGVKRYRIAAWESPYVNPRWFEMMERDWGKGSAVWQMRVEGEFADIGTEAALPRRLVLAATQRKVAAQGEKPKEAEIKARGWRTMGVDVARRGEDRSAWALWEGMKLGPTFAWTNPDLMQTVGKTIGLMAQWNVLPNDVVIDDTGVGGGVVDRLWEQGFPVQRYVAGGKSTEPEVLRNQKAESWFHLRRDLESGVVAMPLLEDAAIAELCEPRLEYPSDGRPRMEDKEKTRKRLGRSPDLADAIVMGHVIARRIRMLEDVEAAAQGAGTPKPARRNGSRCTGYVGIRRTQNPKSP